MGILVIGLSLGASFGVCFYMRIFYADMHPIIPFLLLGIGVDDMFVIVQVIYIEGQSQMTSHKGLNPTKPKF